MAVKIDTSKYDNKISGLQKQIEKLSEQKKLYLAKEKLKRRWFGKFFKQTADENIIVEDSHVSVFLNELRVWNMSPTILDVQVELMECLVKKNVDSVPNCLRRFNDEINALVVGRNDEQKKQPVTPSNGAISSKAEPVEQIVAVKNDENKSSDEDDESNDFDPFA